MIAEVISTSTSVSATIPYLEDRTHDAELVHSTCRTPPRDGNEAWIRQPVRTADSAEPGLAQLAAYIDDERKTGEPGIRIAPETIAEFEARAATKPKVTKQYIHIAITYDPRDTPRLTEEQMADDVRGMIHALVEADNAWKQERARTHGYAKAPLVDERSLLVVAVRHKEKSHQHTHVLLCTIDAHGNHLYLPYEYRTLRRFCVQRERELGLRRTRIREPGASQAGYLPGDEPEQSPLTLLRERMQGIAGEAKDADDLRDRLGAVGIELLPADKGHHGWYVRDADGMSMQASDAGLVGRYHPDRIGVTTPKQAAREAAWNALDDAHSYDEFAERLAERGYQPKTTKDGQVIRIERSDRRRDADAGGGSWVPRDLGMRRAPRKGADWWAKRDAWIKDRPPKAPKAKPARPVDDRPIKLVARQPTTMEQLEAFMASRATARDRIGARERETAERRQVTAPKKDAMTMPGTDAKADRDAATKRKIEAAVDRSVDESKVFGQQSDPQTLSMRLRAKGVTTHFDERTKGWYAGIGDVLVPLPTLAGKEPRPGMAMGAAPSPAAPRPVLEPVVDRPKAPVSGPTIPRPPTPPMPDLPKRHRGPSR